MFLDKVFPSRALKRERIELARQQVKAQSKVIESIPSFVRDNDEDQWQVLTTLGEKQNLSETGITSMQKTASKLQYKPGGRCILETMENFVIGKNATITAQGKEGEDAAVEKAQDYWDLFTDSFDDLNTWDMFTKEVLRRTIRDGEAFIRIFQPPSKEGFPMLRFVDPAEIKDNESKHTYGIETDPQDITKVLNYHRTFINTQKVQETEVIPAVEMLHVKILVDSNVKRGMTFFVGAGEFVTKYDKWLDARIELNRIRTMWGMIGNVTGGSSMAAVSDAFPETTGKTQSGGTTTKRVPKPGTVLLTRGVEWKLEALNIKAQDTKDDGRNIGLQQAIATQFPEYIIRGDASNSNFASTMVSESPFVRMIEKYQDIFANVYKAIYKRVIQFGIDNTGMPDNTPTTSEVNFATLLHRDIEKETKAFQIQRLNGWVSSQTASERLGYDWEVERKRIKAEEKEEEDREKKRQGFGPPRPGDNRNNDGGRDNADR